MTAVASGAIKVATLQVRIAATSTVLLMHYLAFANTGGTIADIAVYIVLDGNTSATADNFFLNVLNATGHRHSNFSIITEVPVGDHTFDMYAVTGAPSLNKIAAAMNPIIIKA